MKVKELIEQLQKTGLNNEVYIVSEDTDFTPNLYLSFDDIGDVSIYEVKE